MVSEQLKGNYYAKRLEYVDIGDMLFKKHLCYIAVGKMKIFSVILQASNAIIGSEIVWKTFFLRLFIQSLHSPTPKVFLV